MRIIRKLLAFALLVIFIAVTNIVFCQSPSAPDYWQTITASTADRYSDYLYDTVISRTCGHSITVSCARMVDPDGTPIHHQLVLRCMNHGNYFSADILKNTKDTVYTSMFTYVDNTLYYIRDMRVSDSICYFCGMKETRRKYIKSEDPGIPLDEIVYHKGFLARLGLMGIFQDSNAMFIPISPDPPPGPMTPVPVTERGLGIEITDIAQTSTLDKMWVDNGLNVDGFRTAQFSQCPSDTPYTELAVWVDSSFTIDSAHAYIIGRQDNMSLSCLVEVEDNLGITTTPAHYKVYRPSMPEEILTDVTGTDCRVIFSSRIFKDTMVGELRLPQHEFLYDYTVGIRYKDMFTGDNDYLNHLHLYSHKAGKPEYTLGDEEYAHLCRLKNYHTTMFDGSVYYYDKDFGYVYTCRVGHQQEYTPGSSKSFVFHIDKNMDVNTAFTLGGNYNGGYLIRDVAYIGNYYMNCLAIAYKPSRVNIYYYYPYIELIDWAYSPYWHLFGNFNHSVKFPTTSVPTSLDVFMDGRTLNMGGFVYPARTMELATQKRSAVIGATSDVICSKSKTEEINNGSCFDVTHAVLDEGLIRITEAEIEWMPYPSIATKHNVNNICTEAPKREEGEEDATEIEQPNE